MFDPAKLRKVSADLYVEDFVGKDGQKGEFKYARGFELLSFELYDVFLSYDTQIDLKEFQTDFREFSPKPDRPDDRKDRIESRAFISASGGEFSRGDTITVIDYGKPLTLSRASSIFIHRMPQWDEVIASFREKARMLWMGRAIVFTPEDIAKGCEGEAGQIHLEMYLPQDHFDYIASLISASAPDRLRLHASIYISAFRSEVDKALAEPWHPIYIGVYKTTPAILYRLSASLKATNPKTLTEPVDDDALARMKSRGGQSPPKLAATDIWLPRLFGLGVIILLALAFRLR